MAPPITWNSRFTRTEQEQEQGRAGTTSQVPPLPSIPAPVARQLGDRNDSKLGIPWTRTVTLRYDCLTALRVPSSRHMHACHIPCHA